MRCNGMVTEKRTSKDKTHLSESTAHTVSSRVPLHACNGFATVFAGQSVVKDLEKILRISLVFLAEWQVCWSESVSKSNHAGQRANVGFWGLIAFGLFDPPPPATDERGTTQVRIVTHTASQRPGERILRIPVGPDG